MKKGLFLLSLIVTFYALGTVSASAVTNDTVKVGLRYGSSVMSSANLENDEGSGYEFGYFEDDRTFVSPWVRRTRPPSPWSRQAGTASR